MPGDWSRLEVEATVADYLWRGSVVSVPPQSAPRLWEARGAKEHALEAGIPRHLDDLVFVLAERLGASPTALRGAIVRYYLNEVRRKPATARRIERLARSALADGRCDTRISVRLDRSLWEAAWTAGESVGLTSHADLVRGALVAAKEDVIDGRASARRRDLERLAAAI